MRLLIAWLLLLSTFVTLGSGSMTRFEHLGLKQGLSQSLVYSIVQDNKGFLWFATQDGLNRYDGNTFKVYRHDPQNPHSISANWIEALFIDSKQQLWIGTLGGGLNRFDPVHERFIRFEHDSSDSNSISDNQIQALAEDNLGRLWIGTKGGGLNLLDQHSGRFSHFSHDSNQADSISDNDVRSLLIDSQGQLWIGTADGLDRINVNESITSPTFYHHKHNSKVANSLSHNAILSLLEDSRGHIWVGTDNGLNRFAPKQQTGFSYLERFGHHPIKSIFEDSQGILWSGTENGGLIKYEPLQQRIVRFYPRATEPDSLNDHTVRSIFEDAQGILWIGTQTGGINKLDQQKQRFNHFKSQAYDLSNSLSDNTVTAFYVDSKGILWVGTGSGLNRYDSKTQRFKHFKHQPQDPNSLSSDQVRAIVEDRQGRLWIGTFDGGLNLYDRHHQQFSRIRHDPTNPHGLASDRIATLYIDKQDRLWLGSVESGLSLYLPHKQRFIHYGSITSGVYNMIEDPNGLFWLGHRDGLKQFDPDTQTIVSYRHQGADPLSLSDDSISDIYQAQDGSLWIGTANGLNRFDRQAKTFKHYTTKDGLPNNFIYGILEDQQGRLWLSTNRGLSRFDPAKETFSNFDVNDGLQSNEFNGNAFYKSAYGELFFGGINGFNRFFGEYINDDKQVPRVALTDFLLANQRVTINPERSSHDQPDFYLPKNIDDLEQLTLGYQQNLISFEFAAMHFANPSKNQYAYKLDGFDTDWIYTDAKKPWATYTRLPAGGYRLKVKASNHLGYWNEQYKSLAIKVLPPPWQTWWAYLIYLSLIVLFIGALFHAQRKKVLYERQKVQDERAVVQRLTELDKLKDEFLANTSHELRTPLHGIIGLSESLIDGVAGELPKDANHNLALVVASARGLSNLVNDILDFSKLKNTSLSLHTRAVDLYSLVEVVLAMSKPLVGDKPVELINDIYKDLPSANADENRLMQILYNLVGNAIKFTASGNITVTAKLSPQMGEQRLTVCVTDTGVGIESKDIERIFDSFEQVEGAGGGTGLGLAVSKQLVELHGGELEVRSTPGQGSTFSFTLLKAQEQGDRLGDQNTGGGQMISRLHQFDEDKSVPLHTSEQGAKGFRILLVDDEPVNLQVLHNLLSMQNYQLVEASGGEQALAIIAEQAPFDLVLLDIMMPKMSGYEVCRRLRETYCVSDLPVIFLTAKNQVTDLVQSFAMGGNDYLTKPVSKHELLSRVETHLKLLDINRNLEQKVQERTKDLEQKHQQLMESEKALAQKEQQRKLAQSETLASLGTLTAGIGHEIKNPVNFIGLGAYALGEDLKAFEAYLIELAGEDAEAQVLDSFRQQLAPLYKHVDTIVDGTDRVKLIVEDLRSFTQQDSDEQQTVNIGEKLQSTLNLVMPKYIETIDFSTEFDFNIKLKCYPAQLNQVFMNLVVNACDAIEQRRGEMAGQPSFGKPLSTERGKVDVGCRQVDHGVEIFVSDNGIGMSDETLNRLFEPFYTTKGESKGTGLGLSISYGIMQKHGGELTVESKQGVGTRFVMRC